MMIRPAVEADMPAVAAIQVMSWRTAYQGLLSDAYLGTPVENDLKAKWIGFNAPQSDVLLVATEGGIVSGFIYVKGDRDPAYIDNLHVDPTRKRSGIGAALMREAAHELIAKGHSGVTLTVITDNAPAVAFYDKMGGARGAAQDELLYGEPVRTYPYVWSDLEALAG